MDALSTTATDVFGADPVVLASIEDIAHLVCSDSVHIFIIATHFFPLEESQENKVTHVQNKIGQTSGSNLRVAGLLRPVHCCAKGN